MAARTTAQGQVRMAVTRPDARPMAALSTLQGQGRMAVPRPDARPMAARSTAPMLPLPGGNLVCGYGEDNDEADNDKLQVC